jgi:hypothetical protein
MYVKCSRYIFTSPDDGRIASFPRAVLAKAEIREKPYKWAPHKTLLRYNLQVYTKTPDILGR